MGRGAGRRSIGHPARRKFKAALATAAGGGGWGGGRRCSPTPRRLAPSRCPGCTAATHGRLAGEGAAAAPAYLNGGWGGPSPSCPGAPTAADGWMAGAPPVVRPPRLPSTAAVMRPRFQALPGGGGGRARAQARRPPRRQGSGIERGAQAHHPAAVPRLPSKLGCLVRGAPSQHTSERGVAGWNAQVGVGRAPPCVWPTARLALHADCVPRSIRRAIDWRDRRIDRHQRRAGAKACLGAQGGQGAVAGRRGAPAGWHRRQGRVAQQIKAAAGARGAAL